MSKTQEALKQALETAEGIASCDWRKWEELASPEEFERWVKSRALHMATALREALAEQTAQQEPKPKFVRNVDGVPCITLVEHEHLMRSRSKPAQQQEPDKNGSPCPEFWDWLPKAYNFVGDGNFTKYNMEVAFLAGKQSVSTQDPVAWINWCAATGKRSVSFECESELASEPLYAGITQNTQYHYSKFHLWFDSELHRQKYTKDHPAYLAAQEAWNAANDAAQHRINRLNSEIEAWKVRFKIAEDALAKLNVLEQKPVATMWQHGETGRTRITMPGDITDCDARWFKVSDLYTSPPANANAGKPWVGLTVREIEWCFDDANGEGIAAARNIEAKLREKNA